MREVTSKQEPGSALGTGSETPHQAALERDAIAACAQLIRFDTSNFGDGDARGERPAAEWVAAQLRDCGYEPTLTEAEPERTSVVVRIPGRDRTRGALLVHGHLDVVPADAGEWSVDPFGGEVRDGAVWGRGALDMKGDDAMLLAVARGFHRDGFVPARDIVLAFVADEETGGRLGAGHIVVDRPDLLAGVTHAIGEGGGVLHRLPDGGHLYPVACGERGTAWIQLTARGPAGHGSRPLADNAVAVLARTVAELAAIEWPIRVIPQVAALLEGLGDRLALALDPADPDLRRRLGDAAPLVQATVANTLSPTMLSAGYKANVIPAEATAVIDGRVLPGHEQEFLDAIDAVLPDAVTRSSISDQGPISADHEDPEVARLAAAVAAHDPGALVLPCCAGGGTDAKWFDRLGIACYGFLPGRSAPGEDLSQFVHGIDEHVPTDSLAFGARVLDTYLRSDPTDPPSEETP